MEIRRVGKKETYVRVEDASKKVLYKRNNRYFLYCYDDGYDHIFIVFDPSETYPYIATLCDKEELEYICSTDSNGFKVILKFAE